MFCKSSLLTKYTTRIAQVATLSMESPENLINLFLYY